MNTRSLACGIAVASALAAAAPLLAARKHVQPPSAGHRVVSQAGATQNQNIEEEGQRVFEQNCARCHNAPDGFSPRTSGTILRHMRVRANLSQHDETVLLHYFNQ